MISHEIGMPLVNTLLRAIEKNPNAFVGMEFDYTNINALLNNVGDVDRLVEFLVQIGVPCSTTYVPTGMQEYKYCLVFKKQKDAVIADLQRITIKPLIEKMLTKTKFYQTGFKYHEIFNNMRTDHLTEAEAKTLTDFFTANNLHCKIASGGDAECYPITCTFSYISFFNPQLRNNENALRKAIEKFLDPTTPVSAVLADASTNNLSAATSQYRVPSAYSTVPSNNPVSEVISDDVARVLIEKLATKALFQPPSIVVYAVQSYGGKIEFLTESEIDQLKTFVETKHHLVCEKSRVGDSDALTYTIKFTGYSDKNAIIEMLKSLVPQPVIDSSNNSSNNNNNIRNDLDSKKSLGFTSLWTAAVTGSLQEVQNLIRQEVDLNEISSSNGLPPIWGAVNLGKVDIITALINAGAKVDIKDKNQISLLEKAQSKGNATIIQLVQNALIKQAGTTSAAPAARVIPVPANIVAVPNNSIAAPLAAAISIDVAKPLVDKLLKQQFYKNGFLYKFCNALEDYLTHAEADTLVNFFKSKGMDCAKKDEHPYDDDGRLIAYYYIEFTNHEYCTTKDALTQKIKAVMASSLSNSSTATTMQNLMAPVYALLGFDSSASSSSAASIAPNSNSTSSSNFALRKN